MKIPLLSLWLSHFKCSNFIPKVTRKDKFGIIIKVIFRTFDIWLLGVLIWWLLVVKRGDNTAPIFQICSNRKLALNNLCKKCKIMILVDVPN